MNKINYVTPERKIELDSLLEKEILDLKNNAINKEEFITYIKLKKISFQDFCYLIEEYVGPVKLIEDPMSLLPHIDINSIDELFNEVRQSSIEFNYSKNNIPKIQHVKRIKKYENIALKNRQKRKI